MTAHALFCCQQRLRSRKVSVLLFLRSAPPLPFRPLNQTSPPCPSTRCSRLSGERWRRTLRQSQVVKRKESSARRARYASRRGASSLYQQGLLNRVPRPQALRVGRGEESHLAASLGLFTPSHGPSLLLRCEKEICTFAAVARRGCGEVDTENDNL